MTTTTDKSQVKVIEGSVRDTLSRYQERMRALGTAGPDLVEQWDAACSTPDPNAAILANLNAIQVMVTNVFDEIHEQKAVDAEKCAELFASAEPKDIARGWKLKDNSDKRTRDNYTLIQNLTKTANSLAKEYRQCITTQNTYFHVNLIIQFMVILRGTLHKFITDDKLLFDVSKELDEQCSRHFPLAMRDAGVSHDG